MCSCVLLACKGATALLLLWYSGTSLDSPRAGDQISGWSPRFPQTNFKKALELQWRFMHVRVTVLYASPVDNMGEIPAERHHRWTKRSCPCDIMSLSLREERERNMSTIGQQGAHHPRHLHRKLKSLDSVRLSSHICATLRKSRQHEAQQTC